MRPGSTDAKAVVADRVAIFNHHSLNVRARGTESRPRKQRVDSVPRPFDFDLHGAVGPVANPPTEVEALGLESARVAKEDALHAAIDDGPAPH